ncbi:MAG: alpha/beta hydrolase [Proteobacteria bacterium]|nr:MAG: alpha/beta hydrolase [Pseudomonadota bacterium]QKK12374.1 MAG: alpha/beta hydrolase [Pseudomonadota bacterium]
MTPTLPRDIEIQTRYLRIAARQWGDPNGVPVMAIHGWLDNAASFDALAPLLTGMNLIAVDMPGHGRSEHRPPGTPYHFIDSIPDVLAIADALDWPRFSLLSHSLGAGISAIVAGTAPQRIRRLVLIEGLGPWSGSAEESPERLSEATNHILYKERRRAPSYPTVEEAAHAREKAGDLGFEAAMMLAGRGTYGIGDRVAWRTDPRLTYRSPLYLTEEQVGAFLPRISAPTLLIWGESGLDSPLQNLEERKKLVPDLIFQRIPGGHHLHMDNPEPVAAVVQPFLVPVT